VVKKISFK